MWRYRDLPIQHKITLIIVLGMACAMFVTVVNFISFDRKNVMRDLNEEMRVLARITAARSAVAVAFGDRSNALENLSTLSIRSTVQFACIYNQDQQLFAHFERKNSRYGKCPGNINVFEAAIAGKERDNLLIIVEPILKKSKNLGFVLVASDLSRIAERTRKWIVTSTLVTFSALLVAYLMTMRLQRSIVKPIRNLASVMDEVKRINDLSLRAIPHGQDEVGHLVDSFNDMIKILQFRTRDLEHLYKGLVEKSAEAEANAASLEVRNQHIQELFSSAAHDLRQPLQAMSIFADTWQRKIEDDDQKEILEKLKQAMRNLSDLFHEILDVSRFDFDISMVGTQVLPIKPLLDKLYLEFDAMAQQKGLKLKFKTLDCNVMAHAALLERIVRNLLSNAIRYTDRGGVLLGCRRRGAYLSIEVWDTGHGIPEDMLSSVFSKYVQINNQHLEDREREGFGMGLAIVKQFIDTLGYKINVKSCVDKGTLFRILIPMEKSRGLRTDSSDSDSNDFSAISFDTLETYDEAECRICLVDDSAAVRSAIRLMLEGWGFVVDDFKSIASMRRHYRGGGVKPRLMISDYQLGNDETGRAAIDFMCELLGEKLPGIIVSGAEDESVWQEIRASGYKSLKKPIKPARLRALINHLLQ